MFCLADIRSRWCRCILLVFADTRTHGDVRVIQGGAESLGIFSSPPGWWFKYSCSAYWRGFVVSLGLNGELVEWSWVGGDERRGRRGGRRFSDPFIVGDCLSEAVTKQQLLRFLNHSVIERRN